MCAAETGLQLFGRLTPRPKLHDLDHTLFPNGLQPKEVIEINGDTNCGKTLLLTQMIMKCVLPKTFENVQLDGLDCGVLFINTDHHFVIFKLAEMLEQYVLNKCVSNRESVSISSATMENLIKSSLNNLFVLNVFDGFQLKITMHTVKQMMSDNPKISLVLLDSATSNYWQDIQSEHLFGNVKKMDAYLKNIVKIIQCNTIDFNTCLIYTRPSYFKTKQLQPDSVPGLGKVTRKIFLKAINLTAGILSYQCTVTTSCNKIVKYYKIGSNGFQWISEKSN